MKYHSLTISLLFAGLTASYSAIADISQGPVTSDCQMHSQINYRAKDGDKIRLTPPQDMGFREMMGGAPEELSMESFHAATGSMYVAQISSGKIYITFDFHGLLPLGVYTLWDVSDPNYQNDTFADAPLMDQSGIFYDVNPGRLGAPEGYGSHGFQANKCGSANFTIELNEEPGTEFLLDFHSNGFEPGVKGETIFPGVLWGKFPEWKYY